MQIYNQLHQMALVAFIHVLGRKDRKTRLYRPHTSANVDVASP